MTTLIVGYSGRALAAAAAKVGKPVRVIDWFADDDTVALAEAYERISPGPDGQGFDRDALIAALGRLAPGCQSIVYGTGFEASPDLIDLLAEYGPVMGNSAEQVRAVKDPMRFASLLTSLGISHPETQFDRPAGPGWLAKRIGGSGGGHIRPAETAPDDGSYYFQRLVTGEPLSVLFTADGVRAAVIGFSGQWASPTAEAPYRYGGCAGPVALDAALDAELSDICDRLAAAIGLVGLNGIDCLIGGEDGICVVEVNPRPVASIDLFDHLGDLSLWTAHFGACQGRLAIRPRFPAVARAASVVYASHALILTPGFAWPDEAVDRTPGGTSIAAGEPICSLVSTAPEWAAARAMNNDAARRLEERLGRQR